MTGEEVIKSFVVFQFAGHTLIIIDLASRSLTIRRVESRTGAALWLFSHT
jgi:hypothetical protein